MYVCICNKVTTKQIHKAAADGAQTIDCLHRALNVGGCCGKCRPFAKQVLADAQDDLWNSDGTGDLQLQPA